MIDLKLELRVEEALARNQPVVALESTVIAHGLPPPLNLECARDCQQAVTDRGAVPATVAVVSGRPVVGLSERELEIFAAGRTPEGALIEKVNPSNLAGVRLRGGWGATTVAATLEIAHLAGLRVFATGGIGGVHRDVSDSFDISADLTALARIPMVCVSAGAKSILDLPKTVERLETLGVPIVGYGTGELPAFYCRRSGLAVDVSVETAAEAAALARLHWETGMTTAVLVCVPVPEESEIATEEVERATLLALDEARLAGVRGKALTPFLLSRMEKLTGGNTLKANRALLVNNAGVAADIARELSL